MPVCVLVAFAAYFTGKVMIKIVLAVHHDSIVENTIKTEEKTKTSLLVVLVVKQANSESILILLSVIYIVQALKPDLDDELAEKMHGREEICIKF